jgi:GDPmannose 4,6-dehydratase
VEEEAFLMKKALVTGLSGQDASYLAELLLEKGYEVHGLVRRVSSGELRHLTALKDRLILHEGDLTERGFIARLFKKVKFDEVYNLGAMSFVKASFEIPEYTCDVNGLAVVRLLEEIRNADHSIRMYQASTSEQFGSSPAPQNELTSFHPRSPYGCAKLLAHAACVNYREAYGLHVSCGILYNHESKRRGAEFVTQKIANGVARISLDLQKELRLGNLDARRDWGHAKDYVEAMWLMLQQPSADDYVIATGQAHTIGEFADAAFSYVGLRWRDYVKIDEAFMRPADVHDLCGDASKARAVLGWHPKTSFKELVEEMVDAALVRAKLEVVGGGV